MDHFSIALREYKDDNFVGQVQICTERYPNDKRVYIHDLYVIKAYRHKGYGIKLMNRIIDTCKKLSIPEYIYGVYQN